jgi:hypothetical protein
MTRPITYPCGTARQAIARHKRNGEPLCRKCEKFKRENVRAKAEVAECGTRGGYNRHRKAPDYAGKVDCADCRKANADWQNAYVNPLGQNNVERMQMWVLLNPERYKEYHRNYYYNVVKPRKEAGANHG